MLSIEAELLDRNIIESFVENKINYNITLLWLYIIPHDISCGMRDIAQGNSFSSFVLESRTPKHRVMIFDVFFFTVATFKINSQRSSKQQILIGSMENQYLPVATDILQSTYALVQNVSAP